jgi:hypothetical protein
MVAWWLLPVAFFAGVFIGTVVLGLALSAGDWRE